MNRNDAMRIILFKEGDAWIGQCLEHDICAQGPDLNSVRSRLTIAIEAEVAESLRKNEEPLATIGPAPKHFHEMWDRRSPVFPSSNLRIADGATLDCELALCA